MGEDNEPSADAGHTRDPSDDPLSVPLKKSVSEDLFALKPVDGVTLALALEDWEIWKRWETAFHAQRTGLDTHPALPEDRARYETLKVALDQRLSIGSEPPVPARADFQPASESNSWASFRVKWTLVQGG